MFEIIAGTAIILAGVAALLIVVYLAGELA